jgi:iron complex outermembrane recepter protein
LAARSWSLLAATLVFMPLAANSQSDVLNLSLEELLNVEVTTASRKAERLLDVAAAAFVITRDDIEQSGATSIPEALRMAPGVQVARLSNNRWAVSVRGFNGRFANKLLVLVNGRSVYSPLYSGVIWEAEDTLLDDVDRIEVIRGPGAAMWGANAVNGVINVITRRARDSQGNLLVAGLGTEEGAFAAFRHGGESGEGHYRVWGKVFARDESVDLSGNRASDDWRAGRMGFRGDWPLAAGDRLTVSGSAYKSTSGDRWNYPDLASASGSRLQETPQSNQGAHVIGRREWTLADGSEASIQGYLDHSEVDIARVVKEHRTTADLDFQHRKRFGERHDLVWGLGYRLSHDDIDARSLVDFSPRSRDFRLVTAFAQDDITLVPDTLRLMLGARLEHNSFTGFEPQPNLRVLWTPTPRQAWWAAASRAVRTPSRVEEDAQWDLGVTPASAPGNPTGLPVLTRNVPMAGGELVAEKVTALEVGVRHRFDAGLSVDITAFHNRYRDLRANRRLAIDPVYSATPYLLQRLTSDNNVAARSHGLELALDWHPTAWWRLQSTYSYLRVSSWAETDDPIDRMNAVDNEGIAPRHQFSLRSSMSFSNRHRVDAWLRYVSEISSAYPAEGTIPAYTTLDLRYAWRPTPKFELSLVGQNLLDRRHQEFGPVSLPSELTQVERGFYIKGKWQF